MSSTINNKYPQGQGILPGGCYSNPGKHSPEDLPALTNIRLAMCKARRTLEQAPGSTLSTEISLNGGKFDLIASRTSAEGSGGIVFSTANIQASTEMNSKKLTLKITKLVNEMANPPGRPGLPSKNFPIAPPTTFPPSPPSVNPSKIIEKQKFPGLEKKVNGAILTAKRNLTELKRSSLTSQTAAVQVSITGDSISFDLLVTLEKNKYNYEMLNVTGSSSDTEKRKSYIAEKLNKLNTINSPKSEDLALPFRGRGCGTAAPLEDPLKLQAKENHTRDGIRL
jgi:hypothetical protein